MTTMAELARKNTSRDDAMEFKRNHAAALQMADAGMWEAALDHLDLCSRAAKRLRDAYEEASS